MLKYCLVFIVSQFIFSGIFAQKKYSGNLDELIIMNKKAEGTYQIQVIDSREMPSIPFDFVKLVESKRDSVNTIFFYIKPTIRVKVLPYKVINSYQFERLQPVIYINSNEMK